MQDIAITELMIALLGDNSEMIKTLAENQGKIKDLESEFSEDLKEMIKFFETILL
jgi:hypothetical protein